MKLDRNRVIERTHIELRARYSNVRDKRLNEYTMAECVVAASVAVVDEWNECFEKALASADTDLLERAMVALAERVRARERGQDLQEHVDREHALRRLAWSPPPGAHADRIHALASVVRSVGGTISMATHDEIVLEYPEHARDQVEREAERLHLLNRPPPDERDVEVLRQLAARSIVDERAEMMRRLSGPDLATTQAAAPINPFVIARSYDGRTGERTENGMIVRECHGDCSRGGDGPPCGLPGCRG